jgi:squalene-hopene/tetraprenyl-beta-curcumene cyclase
MEALLAERNARGYWEGELATSALSTATAVTALAVLGRVRGETPTAHRRLIAGGLRWLATHANADGGWGDTAESFSNLSTTALGWAALGMAPEDGVEWARPRAAAERWLRDRLGDLTPDRLTSALVARYGKDKTFAVPILLMCALAGRLGPTTEAWRHVPQLPFELAALPAGVFAALRLPVVSYALPALIAIGQARHHRQPTRGPARWIRNATRARTLAVLARIQPPHGGFLEATPLTSFVAMALAEAGQAEHPVTRRAARFIEASVRPDGSWPIDTHLATWVTTLAVNALGPAGLKALSPEERTRLREWLVGQQYRQKHPYTNAAPGGWAWTDLPGGVPDADDTAGALLALRVLDDGRAAIRQAAERGIRWLLDLQNRDGGIPTFCRGWTNLPFDRSGADLTAHALRAWAAWREQAPGRLGRRLDAARARAVGFLRRVQRSDGAWLPLWFGNQHVPDETNATYGTAKVVRALAAPWVAADSRAAGLLAGGVRWLVAAMNPEGSWGGGEKTPASVEETALAVEALAAHRRRARDLPGLAPALARGEAWLERAVAGGSWRRPAPIGFYFARLWYFERLYPLIGTAAAFSVGGEGN